ncbi:MAG: flagellar hook-associated protein FlgL [Sedimentibacter sp.]|jgi:flagellar hook-associated protein 3 FlgL|nr:flagellar hook-associated protein FlgL [Sedimentibacter sp.]
MRITTSMMSNKYIRNLNKSASEMNYLNEQVSTGKKFFKGSEDAVSAIKAYKLRREYRTSEIYDTNIKDVDSFLTTAETNLTEISSNIEKVYTSYLKGITGTMGSEEREIVAKELENLQQSILTSLNANYGDKYVFGGTSKDEIPFTLEDVTLTDGTVEKQLFFKGINVNTNDARLDDLKNETINVDIGLGMTFGSDGKLNGDTVFNMSMSGINFMGYGENSGMPNNVYTLIGKIKDELRDPNFNIDNVTPYIGKFEEQKKQVLVGITDIGAKTNYLDFIKVRNEDNQFNINEKILDVEYVDPAEAIVNFKMQEYSYNAALSMGNKILQNSFIDFMK